MLKKVIKAAQLYGMFEDTSSVTVALSGGADSVTLLHVLLELSKQYSFTVKAAHFNHKIRGEESERDRAFCEELCQRLNVELTVGSADVPAYAKENAMGTELAARELRYEFFSSLKADKIATAHTASDNLETLIFNLTRGSGAGGMRGIPPVRDNYIRPLIFCTREEIENYCRDNSLTFVTDSTNLTDDCTRNVIRHNVIPVLKQINPSVEAAGISVCEALRQDEECLMGEADDYFEHSIRENALKLDGFSLLKKAVAIRVLRRFYSEFFGTLPDSFHLNALYDICVNAGKLSLYKSFFAVSDKKTLKIENSDKKAEFSVTVDKKKNDFFKNGKKINNLLLKNVFDCDKIVGDLKIRTRCAGDKMRLASKQGTKTFKKLYNEYKIPAFMRESLPVISDDLGPVWVYKIGVAQRCAANENTKDIFCVNVKEFF